MTLREILTLKENLTLRENLILRNRWTFQPWKKWEKVRQGASGERAFHVFGASLSATQWGRETRTKHVTIVRCCHHKCRVKWAIGANRPVVLPHHNVGLPRADGTHLCEAQQPHGNDASVGESEPE
mmetsp:Transcript_118666/g.236377  ORF Transcript_118666/g.236377 Transcript_118666/m.236377 type:complete len:126 (-) Transcript_118666:101-478(-)